MKPDNKKTNTPPTNPSETDSETNWWVGGGVHFSYYAGHCFVGCILLVESKPLRHTCALKVYLFIFDYVSCH